MSSATAPNPAVAAKVLLFTGKGGVGKTTTAAATAVELAQRGRRVVVTSADPAHSLADVFDVAVGPEPTAVAARCDAQQLDALARMEDSWGEIRSWMVAVLDWAGMSAVEAEELALLPGFEELVALMEIERLVNAGHHDVVVVDCAPTAETIRLLSLPDALDWYVRHLFAPSRRLARIARPVVSRLSDVPLASPEVFDAFEDFHSKLLRVRDLLTDPDTTRARIVVTPERVVVSEAMRTLTYLSLFGYRVDAVVVNRLLPAADGDGGQAVDGFMERMRDAQGRQMAGIGERFAPLRILTAELAADEVVGVDRLGDHGKRMWDGLEPEGRLSDMPGMRMEHDGDESRLVLPLPSVTSEEVGLVESGGELVVTVGPYRRNLALPSSLRSRPVTGARVRGSDLVVGFGPRSADASRPSGVQRP